MDLTALVSNNAKNYVTIALLKLTDDIGRYLDKKKLAGVLVLLDITETFATVDHALLCLKLRNTF